LNGSSTTSPYSFNHNSLIDYNISIAGQNYPTQKLKFDFASSETNELYKYVLDNCGLVHNKSNAWTIKAFNKDFFLLAEVFGADPCFTNIGQVNTGSLSIDVKFAKELPKAISVVVIGETPQTINIIILTLERCLLKHEYLRAIKFGRLHRGSGFSKR
jgi:hypothetical protein